MAGAQIIPEVSFGAAMEGHEAQVQSDQPAGGVGSPAPHSFQEA